MKTVWFYQMQALYFFSVKCMKIFHHEFDRFYIQRYKGKLLHVIFVSNLPGIKLFNVISYVGIVV